MRYAAIGLALILGAGIAYGQQQTCPVIGNPAFCSDSVLVVASLQDATADRRSDAEGAAHLHKVQLTEARVERAELSSQRAQVRAFPNEASARSYVQQTLRQQLLSARAAQTTEKSADPWWINRPVTGHAISFHLLLGNAVTDQLHGIIYELARVRCAKANQATNADYLVMTGSAPIARSQESLFNVQLRLPQDHPLQQQNSWVCGTVVGVF